MTPLADRIYHPDFAADLEFAADLAAAMDPVELSRWCGEPGFQVVTFAWVAAETKGKSGAKAVNTESKAVLYGEAAKRALAREAAPAKPPPAPTGAARKALSKDAVAAHLADPAGLDAGKLADLAGHLKTLTVPELSALKKQYGLAGGKVKQDHVDAIVAFAKARSEPDATPDAPAPATPPAPAVAPAPAAPKPAPTPVAPEPVPVPQPVPAAAPKPANPAASPRQGTDAPPKAETDAGGEMHTDLTGIDGEAAARRLAPGLRHMAADAPLYAGGDLPGLGFVFKLVRDKVPDATPVELYAALQHLRQDRTIELGVLNEVKSLDPATRTAEDRTNVTAAIMPGATGPADATFWQHGRAYQLIRFQAGTEAALNKRLDAMGAGAGPQTAPAKAPPAPAPRPTLDALLADPAKDHGLTADHVSKLRAVVAAHDARTKAAKAAVPKPPPKPAAPETPEVEKLGADVNDLIRRAQVHVDVTDQSGASEAIFDEIRRTGERFKTMPKTQLLQVARLVNSDAGLGGKSRDEIAGRLVDMLNRTHGTMLRVQM